MLSDPCNLSTSTLIIIAVVTIILNGIITLSGSSIEAVSRSSITRMLEDDETDARAGRILKFIETPYIYRYTNKLWSYIFMSIGLVAVLFTGKHSPVFLIAYFFVMISLGEMFPRRLAKQNCDEFARGLCGLQNIFNTVTFPLIWVLLKSANIMLRVFKQKTDIDEKEYSEEEIMSILELGQLSGSLREEGKKMIGSIFRFDDELAYEIMTPRTDVFMIDITDPPEEYVNQLMKLRYTRMPVCRNGSDDIIGILHIKDYLIKAREAGFDKVDIESILREPYFVPETKKIDTLFFELQKERQHIAILIDEYGGFSGIVTMEDIIEEIVREIDDEYDEEEVSIEKSGENCYLIDGNADLDDIDEELGISISSDTSETIGGYIIDILGEIPKDGYINKVIEVDNMIFTVLSVKERRIERVRLEIIPNSDASEDDAFTGENDTEEHE